MNYAEKNKFLDRISLIALMCIFVEVFLYAVDYCYTERLDLIVKMPTAMNVFGAVFLVISIILFIMAYRKSFKKYIWFASEFLALAFICPLITYWYYPKAFGLTTNWFHHVSHKALWGVVLAYFIFRVLYVAFHDFKVFSFKKFKANKLKKRKSN